MGGNNYEGICPSCAQAEGCVIQRSPNAPVLNCGLFEECVHQPGEAVPQALRNTGAPGATTTGTEENSSGLCSTCDGQDDCLFPRQEGRIWRCEEYH